MSETRGVEVVANRTLQQKVFVIVIRWLMCKNRQVSSAPLIGMVDFQQPCSSTEQHNPCERNQRKGLAKPSWMIITYIFISVNYNSCMPWMIHMKMQLQCRCRRWPIKDDKISLAGALTEVLQMRKGMRVSHQEIVEMVREHPYRLELRRGVFVRHSGIVEALWER